LKPWRVPLQSKTFASFDFFLFFRMVGTRKGARTYGQMSEDEAEFEAQPQTPLPDEAQPLDQVEADEPPPEAQPPSAGETPSSEAQPPRRDTHMREAQPQTPNPPEAQLPGQTRSGPQDPIVFVHPARTLPDWGQQRPQTQAPQSTPWTGAQPPQRTAPSQTSDLRSLSFDLHQKLTQGSMLTGQERAALTAMLDAQLAQPVLPSPTRSVDEGTVQGDAHRTSRVDIETLLTRRAPHPAYIIPPHISGTLASGQRMNQSQLFLSAQATNGGTWIRETPFDLGRGTNRVKGTEARFPGPWPRAGHDPRNISHHLAHWLTEVCRWGRRLQAAPALIMEFAMEHIFDDSTRNTLRQRTQHLNWDDPQSIELFYDIVLEMGAALGCVLRYEVALQDYLTLRINDNEGIIEFYVRLLNTLSLVVNSPLAFTGIDVAQLKVIFVTGISHRPIADGSLARTLEYHPRTQHTFYEPWDLVWANYQVSVSPPQVNSPVRTPAQTLAQPGQPIAAYEAVALDTPGQGRGRGQKRPRGNSPRGHKTPSGTPVRLTGANAVPLGGSKGGSTGGTPSKATRREEREEIWENLPESLKPPLRALRRACLAPNVRTLPPAQKMEVAEVRDKLQAAKQKASDLRYTWIFCDTCAYWGHESGAPECEAPSGRPRP